MTETKFNDAVVFDDALNSQLLQKAVAISFGVHMQDMQWRNSIGTLREVIESLCTFGRGAKNGRCLLQGSVVESHDGVRRLGTNMARNTIMMFDYDKGATIDQIAAQVQKAGLWALLWTTYSNLKPETLIPEKKVETYMRQIGLRGQTPTDQQVLDYLQHSQKILPTFVTNAKVVGREQMEGGVKYRISHPPLPRLRALFVLKDTFDFAVRGGSQQKAITEWKELYAGVSDMFDLPVGDASCVDPSRLMFTPRLSESAVVGEGANEIWVLNGGPLDLDKVPRKEVKTQRAPATKNQFTAFVEKETHKKKDILDSGYALTHPWLRRFAKLCGQHFEIAHWLQDEFPDDVRGTNNSTVKCNFKCPNQDGHTDVSDTDQGFCVWDADGDVGFGASCRHDTCLTESAGDRLWFLDKLFEEYGIDDPEYLMEWVQNDGKVAWFEAKQKEAREKATREAAAASKKAAEDQQAATAAGAPGPIDAHIAGMSSPPSAQELITVEQLIAGVESQAQRGIFAAAVKVKYGGHPGPTKEDIKNDIDRLRDIAAEQATQDAIEAGLVHQEDMTVPREEDRGGDDVVVWVQNSRDWNPTVMNDCVAKQIETKNAKNPRLFRRAEGWVVRVVPHPDGSLVVGELDDDAWSHEIGRLVTFKKQTLTGVRYEDPPAPRVRDYRGRTDKNLPMLDRVIKVPVFDKTGTLVRIPGYVPGMKVYLHPDFQALPVPAKPTPDEVDAAVDAIADVLTDFPFSDDFTGDDQLPLKMEALDPQGHPYPNPERGKSSFANMLSMILQPFVQHLIEGNSPAFHIDKAKAGTGANYLVDVVYLIAEGKRATVRVMSDNNEEFKKTITATLRQGAPIIFVDNINRHVDSGALAAALTSGIWSDRVLGVSEMVDIPVKSVWVMAGNNLTFSGELMRRNVPVRLDADTPNPAQDRKQGFFKHFPLQDHVESIRPQLVQAVHTLIANWFAKGCPHGTATMNSFDHWARVLGGILEAANVEGFLSNIPAYLETNNEEDNSLADYAQALYERYGAKEFSLEQALLVTKNALGAVQFGLDLDPLAKDPVLLSKLGKLIKNQMAKGTYRISEVTAGHHQAVLAKLIRKKTKAGIMLHFSALLAGR